MESTRVFQAVEAEGGMVVVGSGSESVDEGEGSDIGVLITGARGLVLRAVVVRFWGVVSGPLLLCSDVSSRRWRCSVAAATPTALRGIGGGGPTRPGRDDEEGAPGAFSAGSELERRSHCRGGAAFGGFAYLAGAALGYSFL